MVPLVAPPETPPNEVHDAPLTMLRPIVDALGATLLPTDEATDDDLEAVSYTHLTLPTIYSV